MRCAVPQPPAGVKRLAQMLMPTPPPGCIQTATASPAALTAMLGCCALPVSSVSIAAGVSHSALEVGAVTVSVAAWLNSSPALL